MQIEAGKYYKTRDGRKVGPMERNHGNWAKTHPWTAEVCGAVRDDGTWASERGDISDFDLIAEWTEPTEAPAAEPAAAPAVPDRAVPLPAAVTFYCNDGHNVDLCASDNCVDLGGDYVSASLTPATARALAHWLIVFADAADAGEGGE